jgi:hypothetical protein
MAAALSIRAAEEHHYADRWPTAYVERREASTRSVDGLLYAVYDTLHALYDTPPVFRDIRAPYEDLLRLAGLVGV